MSILRWSRVKIGVTGDVAIHTIDGLVKYCSTFSALAMVILHSCTKPSMCGLTTFPQYVGRRLEIYCWSVSLI